jgi:hypothetical protein
VRDEREQRFEMERPDVQPGAPSAPPAPAAPAVEPTLSPAAEAVTKGDVGAYRRARAAERKSGITAPLVSKPAESTPAAPADPASSTEERSAPASEPGTPAAAAPKPKTEARKTELAGEIDSLLERRRTVRLEVEAEERRLADLRKPAASQPAAAPTTGQPPAAAPPTQAEWERFKAMSDAPKLDQFADYADYQMALAVFVADKRHEERSAAATEASTKASQEAELGKVAESWRSRVDAATKKHPDFVKVALEAPTDIRPGSVIDAFILERETGAEVLYYLQSHKADVARIGALSQLQQVAELLKIEASLAAPPPKHVSDAPEPVPTVGARPTEPSDPIAGAIARGDVAGYRRARREQRLAERTTRVFSLVFSVIVALVARLLLSSVEAGGLVLAANAFQTVDWMAMECLDLLLNKLSIASHFNTDNNKDFDKPYAVGESVRIKKPQRFVIRNGLGYTPQPLQRIYTTVASISPSAMTSNGIRTRRP